MADHPGDQRLIVDAVGGAHADLALPFRVGQIVVGGKLGGLDPLPGVDDRPGAHRQPVPVTVGIAIGGGYPRGQRFGFDCLQHADFARGGQAPGVGGQHQIGGGINPLALQPLQQGFLFSGHQIDRDAGLLGKIIQQRLDEIFLAGGVDVDLAFRQRGRGQQNRGQS